MRKDMLGLMEVYTAAHNIESIERVLGHKIPAGTIDSSALSEEVLGLGEVHTIAHNISSIERVRMNNMRRPVGLFEYVWLVIFALSFLIFVGGAIILSIL